MTAVESLSSSCSSDPRTPRTTDARDPRRARHIPTALCFLGLCSLIVICAWQSDDAYVTFRTVRNAWEGYGLTWNPGERVQAYTSPLWLMLGLAAYGLAREVYFSMLVVSILLAAATAWVVVRPLAGRPWMPSLALLLLGTSGAFVDYSTSGLENPLFCMLVASIVALARSKETLGRVFRLSLLASAACLTRPDGLLLGLPPALAAWWRLRRTRGAAAALVLGLAPIVAWEVFSLVYYGSLVPNSALAKLNVEIPFAAILRQGWLYFADSVSRDPVTLATIALALALSLRPAATPFRPLLAGIGFYLAYVVRIGGDFMSGRFFAAPFVAAVAILVAMASDRPWHARITRLVATAIAVALVTYGVAWPQTRWRSGIHYGVGRSIGEIMSPSGIADERAYYYPTTGLARLIAFRAEVKRRGGAFPPYPGAEMGAQFARSADRVAVRDEAGFFGYFAGDKIVLDLWALGDPLLARIPFRPNSRWRVGHYTRPLPDGYLASRREGRNRIADPELAALHDGLALVTGGPVFDPARWREIWRLHTGHYRAVLRRHAGDGTSAVRPATVRED